MIKNKFNPSNRKQMTVLIIVISLIIVVAGYWFYSNEINRLTHQKHKILTAITSLKANEIKNWYNDELSDMQLISANSILLEETETFSRMPSNNVKQKLTRILNQIKIEHG